MKTAASILLIVVVGIALARPRAYAQDATADTLTYRVKRGDSLELIAAEFYGDHTHMIFIMVENKLQHPRALNPGERIKIPVTREITTAKGDTFQTLATTYLGDERRAGYLADFNQMSADDSLATGTPLTIPFHVTHTGAATESLASISLAYFGDAKQAELLRSYNNLDKTSIEKGETIVVPIFHVRVRTSKLPPIDADASTRHDEQRKAALAAASALPVARTAWLQGDFFGVKSALALLADKLDYLDTPTAIEVGLLLGKAYVAYDDTPSAVAAFSQILDRQHKVDLSPFAESPKVLDAWRKAGGHVQGE